MGYVIKHVATAEVGSDSIGLRVSPVFLPATHQLASIRDENNAVLVRGDAVGEMLFSGKGAGSLPSASAVLSDIVDIACHKGGFSSSPGSGVSAVASQRTAQHYVRFPVGGSQCHRTNHDDLRRDGVSVARAAAVWGKNGSAQHHVRILTQAYPRSKVEAAVRNVGKHVPGKGSSLMMSVAE